MVQEQEKLKWYRALYNLLPDSFYLSLLKYLYNNQVETEIVIKTTERDLDLFWEKTEWIQKAVNLYQEF